MYEVSCTPNHEPGRPSGAPAELGQDPMQHGRCTKLENSTWGFCLPSESTSTVPATLSRQSSDDSCRGATATGHTSEDTSKPRQSQQSFAAWRYLGTSLINQCAPAWLLVETREILNVNDQVIEFDSR